MKQIKKLVKNKWMTVIIEDEKTIDTTLCHLQDQNPGCLFFIQDMTDEVLNLRMYLWTLKNESRKITWIV